MKAYPIGEGKHENIHFLVKDKNLTIKVNCFSETGKAYIMNSSVKFNPLYINLHNVHSDIKLKLKKWDFELLGKASDIFDLKFENTEALLKSDYYKNSLSNYFRLFDTQTGNYLYTGYNCTSKEDVKNALIEFNQPDLDDIFEGKEPTLELLLDVNELILKESSEKFKELEKDLY